MGKQIERWEIGADNNDSHFGSGFSIAEAAPEVNCGMSFTS